MEISVMVSVPLRAMRIHFIALNQLILKLDAHKHHHVSIKPSIFMENSALPSNVQLSVLKLNFIAKAQLSCWDARKKIFASQEVEILMENYALERAQLNAIQKQKSNVTAKLSPMAVQPKKLAMLKPETSMESSVQITQTPMAVPSSAQKMKSFVLQK